MTGHATPLPHEPGATPWRAGARQHRGGQPAAPKTHPSWVCPCPPLAPFCWHCWCTGPPGLGLPWRPSPFPALLSPRPHTLLLGHGPSPQRYGDSRRKKPGKEAPTPGSADFGRGVGGAQNLWPVLRCGVCVDSSAPPMVPPAHPQRRERQGRRAGGARSSHHTHCGLQVHGQGCPARRAQAGSPSPGRAPGSSEH